MGLLENVGTLMFLVMCHEGELALLPSGARCRILGLGTEAQTVKIQRLDDGEEFDILPRHLRHTTQDEVEPGAPVVDTFDDASVELLRGIVKLRAEGTFY